MYIEIHVDNEVYITAAEPEKDGKVFKAEEIRDKVYEKFQEKGAGPMSVNLADGGFLVMHAEKVRRAVLIFRDGEPFSVSLNESEE